MTAGGLFHRPTGAGGGAQPRAGVRAEEVFGPVMTFSSLAADSDYGLALAGIIRINDRTVDDEALFGGVGASGTGRGSAGQGRTWTRSRRRSG